MNHRLPFIAFLLTVIAATGSLKSADLPAEPGLTKQPPKDKRFVMCSRGCMVAYKTKIPGTDITFEMVPIPGGKFLMGSPADEEWRSADEGPQLEVDVAPYWIGRFEVTWAEFNQYYELRHAFRKFDKLKIRQVTKDNKVDAVTAPSEVYDPRSRFPDRDHPKFSRFPAVTMRQHSAKQYTKWLSKLTGQYYRLPTEVEWEYACRAGTATAFGFGNNGKQLEDYGWFSENTDGLARQVGGKKPNRWGLFDMHGNAAEWVLGQHTHYRELKRRIDQRKPAYVPATAEYPRIIRGGSANDDAEDCRSASRMRSSDELMQDDPSLPTSPFWLATGAEEMQIGFRLVRPIDPPAIEARARHWDEDIEAIRESVKERLQYGRGAIGIVDSKLPRAIRNLKQQK